MTAYTITITPDDAAGATTTLRLDASTTGVRITDVHLHASAGLRGGRVPPVDFDMLLRAVNPATAPVLEVTGEPEEPAAGATGTSSLDVVTETTAPEVPAVASPVPDGPPEPPQSDVDGVTGSGAVEPAAAPSGRTARRGGRRAAPSATKATRPRQAAKATRRSAGTRRSASAEPTPEPVVDAAPAKPARGRKPRSTKAAVKTARGSRGATTGVGRAYRRMPDDFASVYQQVGSATAVADHYQVPKHTAHGWIRRLRGQNDATTG